MAENKAQKPVSYKEWMEKHPKTVFTSGPPKAVSRLRSPAEIDFFNTHLAGPLELPPLGAQGDGTLSWCHAESLPGSGWYVCDEDSEA